MANYRIDFTDEYYWKEIEHESDTEKINKKINSILGDVSYLELISRAKSYRCNKYGIKNIQVDFDCGSDNLCCIYQNIRKDQIFDKKTNKTVYGKEAYVFGAYVNPLLISREDELCHYNFVFCFFKKVEFNEFDLYGNKISFSHSIFANSLLSFKKSNIYAGLFSSNSCLFINSEIIFSESTIKSMSIIFKDAITKSTVMFFSNIACDDLSLDFNDRNLWKLKYTGKRLILFNNVKFSKKLHFSGGGINASTIFSRCEFIEDSIVYETSKLLYFDKCNNYSKLTLSNNVDFLFFKDFNNKGSLEISWEKRNDNCFKIDELINIVDDACEAILCHNNLDYFLELFNIDYFSFRDETNLEVSKHYRMLKLNYSRLGWYDEEDKAYFEYMRFKTRDKNLRGLKLFQLIGGFGTKPFRIVLAMLITWLGYAGLYLGKFAGQLKGFSTGNLIDRIIDAVYFSGITFLTIGYGDFSPVENVRLLKLVCVSEGFLGIFLMSYLTVAVVRKLLR